MLIRDREFPAWTPSDRIKQDMTLDSVLIDSALDLNMDQTQLKAAINGSDIHFDKSKVRTKPCRVYEMTTEDNHEMSVQICDSVSTVIRYR